MFIPKNHTYPSYQIIIAFAILIIAGLAVLPLLPVQLNPNYCLPSVQVRFSWRNASPKAVEQEVTAVLEGSLNTIKGIENINSVSSNGSGRIGKIDKEKVPAGSPAATPGGYFHDTSYLHLGVPHLLPVRL